MPVSTVPPARLRWSAVIAVLVLAISLLGSGLPATAQSGASADAQGPSFEDYGFQGEGEARVRDFDARPGRVAPSAAQRQIAAALGADSPRFNAFGTPHVLINHDGYLSGARAGKAADVARAFVRDNARLFRLDAARVDALELLNDSPLYDSPDLGRVYRENKPAANPDVAHVVLFRQRFGNLESALDGLLTVGVQRDGRVAWVSSSVTGDSALSGAQRLDAAEAVRTAAQNVGLDLGALEPVADPAGRYTTFKAAGAADVQRARLVALPTPRNGVRRAFEVTLLDTEIDEHGNPTAFISYVDAETGQVWQRQNKVEHLAEGSGVSTFNVAATQAPLMAPSFGQFSGSTGTGSCGPNHDFTVTEGNGSITVTTTPIGLPEVQDTDIVINLIFEGEKVASADVLNLPEALVYTPGGGVEPGVYSVQICKFVGNSPEDISYTGTFSAQPGDVPGGENGAVELPTWLVFPANPNFVTDGDTEDDSEDTRVLWCWDNDRFEECVEQQRNTASRFPWDVQRTGTPSLTTDGNNASTAVSQASFLTPDTAVNRPFSPNRTYDFPWDNSWFESKCNPANFGTVADDRNDEAAATTNLFVQHNRMHDWSYYLGLTETNYNLQQTNFGNTGPERENDPELGSSQAGRSTVRGRDNANQITLQDGIAPITNQYLWQPLAGAFYAPCVDGAYDQAVVAHEYGHAITNRLIGGPDGGTGPTQGQTESWSDLQFAAYFTEFAISAGEDINPYVLGPYVTGDAESGIRNYAMNHSPLNYSDLDYDGNGLGSPHANGEIWSAANFDILKSLSRKYNENFPAKNGGLQNRCALGELPADECPGNRRWNQLQYDSFLLQPSGVTMIDSRDAMLAADRLRFGGANQNELWNAFARRGLGLTAKSTGPSDVEAIAGWDSPRRDDEALVTFVAPKGVENMEVFLGRYEARATPVADTDSATSTDADLLILPGTYEFIARAPGAGAQRFSLTLGANQRRTIGVPLRRNLASADNGATIAGDGVNLEKLIDDTEETNWASLTAAGTASEGKGEGQQVEGRQVTVDLAGKGPVRVSEIQVSAVLRGPIQQSEDEEELPSDPDPNTQSRFSALRSFDLFTCNADAGADCSKADSFKKVFGSRDDAFPASRPRPTVPDLLLRPFDVNNSLATHVRLVVRDNQCTGGPDFQGETNEDNDPAFNPDCDTTAQSPDRRLLNPPEDLVRAAELQVFSDAAPAPADLQNRALASQVRSIEEACPKGEGDVPRDSRKDDDGNVHEFAIDCMVWYEIAKGTSETKYEPRKAVNREQMAGFIARLIRRSGGGLTKGENAFRDDNKSVFEDDINALAAAGVVEGTGNGRYNPEGTVTRAQMATFLVKAYEFRSANVLPVEGDFFNDDDGDTHERSINKIADAGITVGRNGRYEPGANVFRDEMASFLARTLSLLVDEGTATAKQE